MGCHAENVKKLKNKICNNYQYDFFVNESLKAIRTGKEVLDVAQNMLSCAGAGNEHMKTFVEKSFVKQEISVFDKIKIN